MNHWWKRNEHISLVDTSKDEVEDITGCIPLLLSACVANKKFDLLAPEILEVADQARLFVADLKAVANDINWER